MTLSRTARILLAILLLSAAAFFWVNFFTQNRILAEDPEPPVTAVTPPAPTPAPDADDPDAPAVDPVTEAEVMPDAEVEVDPDAVAEVDPDAVVDPDAEVDPDAVVEPDVDDPAVVVTPDEVEVEPVDDDPVVVIDPPLTVARPVVVSDLPFLITEPPSALDLPDPTAVDPLEAQRALAAARATVNPFSPIVVRRPDAPERDVPDAPTITEVAVPDGPPPEPVRVSTPAPRALAPAPAVSRDLPRALPTGTPLAATPGLLREPRAIDTIDREPLPEITTARLPEDPDAAPVPMEALRPTPAISADVPELRGADPAEPEPEPEPVVTEAPIPGEAPLAAGTNRLTRYLRDKGYTFTGSVLGPVSVGVFRANDDPTPHVVALGQTLPNTEIVLTDLRGQQAELTLDDLSQILILDIRR